MATWNQRALSMLIVLLLLFLFLFNFSSPSSPPVSNPSKLPTHSYPIDRYDSLFQILNDSNYRDFEPKNRHWLDLNGFKEDDDLNWELLSAVRSRATDQIRMVYGLQDGLRVLHSSPKSSWFSLIVPPLYEDISGYVRGQWSRFQVSGELINVLPDNSTLQYRDKADFLQRNVTGHSGDIHFDFSEKTSFDIWDGTSIRGIRADVTLYQIHPEQSWTFSMEGLHILETGTSLMVTSSSKFMGLFALPHLALSERHFSAFQNRLRRTLKEFINAQKALRENSYENGYQEMNVFESQECELVAYLQQHAVPLDASQYKSINALEHELQYPLGRTQASVPNLEMSLVMFSPNCGFIIGTSSLGEEPQTLLAGEKIQLHLRRMRKHFILLGLVLSVQLVLMSRQMKDACTPSTRNRISYYSIFTLTVGDGLIAITCSCLGTASGISYITLLAVAFIAILVVICFDLEFLTAIAAVQHHESMRLRRQGSGTPIMTYTAQQPAPSLEPILTAAGADTLQLPVTSGRIAPSIVSATAISFEEQERLEGQFLGYDTEELNRSSLSVNVIFSIVLIFCITVWALTWQPSYRYRYSDIVSFIYLSFWIPQIYRNSNRNCRKALRWEFVVGQSLLRLTPVIYIYAYDGNLLFMRPNIGKATILCIWIWAQVAVLAIQEAFGPRLLIPNSWVPPAYDYHPILRENDEITRVILGLSTSSIPESSRQAYSKPTEAKEHKSRQLFDCAICMQVLEVPIVPDATWSTSDSLLLNRSYMVTPCRHLFHTRCLEAAMRYRLQCPICRDALPPL